jgi:hypothetical protein
LAQQAEQVFENGASRPLKPRMFYDCNPPSKAHWSYRLFVEKRDPDTKANLSNPRDYAAFQINPSDNVENVSAGYLDTLKNLSTRLQKRFLKGEFADARVGVRCGHVKVSHTHPMVSRTDNVAHPNNAAVHRWASHQASASSPRASRTDGPRR